MFFSDMHSDKISRFGTTEKRALTGSNHVWHVYKLKLDSLEKEGSCTETSKK